MLENINYIMFLVAWFSIITLLILIYIIIKLKNKDKWKSDAFRISRENRRIQEELNKAKKEIENKNIEYWKLQTKYEGVTLQLNNNLNINIEPKNNESMLKLSFFSKFSNKTIFWWDKDLLLKDLFLNFSFEFKKFLNTFPEWHVDVNDINSKFNNWLKKLDLKYLYENYMNIDLWIKDEFKSLVFEKILVESLWLKMYGFFNNDKEQEFLNKKAKAEFVINKFRNDWILTNDEQSTFDMIKKEQKILKELNSITKKLNLDFVWFDKEKKILSLKMKYYEIINPKHIKKLVSFYKNKWVDVIFYLKV